MLKRTSSFSGFSRPREANSNIFITTFFYTNRSLYFHTKLVHILPRYMIIASVLLNMNIFGKFKLLIVLSETLKEVLR